MAQQPRQAAEPGDDEHLDHDIPGEPGQLSKLSKRVAHPGAASHELAAILAERTDAADVAKPKSERERSEDGEGHADAAERIVDEQRAPRRDASPPHADVRQRGRVAMGTVDVEQLHVAVDGSERVLGELPSVPDAHADTRTP